MSIDSALAATDTTPPTIDATPTVTPPASATGTSNVLFSDMDNLTFSEGFVDKLSGEGWDELKPTLSKFKSVQDLGKSYLEAQRAISAKQEGMVKVPGADATDEDKAAFRAALGVPDSVEGYEIEAPENLPEGVEWDDTVLTPLKEEALKLGVTPDQLKGLIAFQADYEGRQYEAQQKAIVEAEKTLVNEWGDSLQSKIADISKRVASTGIDLTQSYISRVDVLKALDHLASNLRPDSTGTAASVVSIASIDAEVKKIITSEGYRNGTDPAARERLLHLYREQARLEKLK